MSQPNDNLNISRRGFAAKATATAGVAAALGATFLGAGDARSEQTNASAGGSSVDAKKGKLKQSFCRWCFKNFSLEDLSIKAASLGLVGIDLLDPKDFPVIKKHGLVCTMVNSAPLADGLCDTKFHDMCIEKISSAIEATSAEGWRNVICFSGNARGIDRETGMNNCIAALKKLTPLAEKKKVILNMELLNSRVNHADYMCDNTTWGIELVKRVGSDNFKLLYDIYHMQIMEGDIIRSIQNNHQYFGHYHTAGNPGRHELDGNQELNYVPIAKAVSEVPFDGYFVHEFIPARDPMTGLEEAVKLCMVY
jgi:hydroxypyruvate isomerase